MRKENHQSVNLFLRTVLFGVALALLNPVHSQEISLLDSARKMYSQNPAQALKLAKQERQKPNIGKAQLRDTWQLIGDIHYYVYDSLEEAKTYYDSALQHTEENEYIKRLEIVTNVTYILNEQNQPREALREVEALFQFPIQIDSSLYFKLLSRKGLSYSLLHNYDSSLYYLGKAMEGYEALGEKRMAFRQLNSIAVVLSESGDDSTAKNYYLKAYRAAGVERDTIFLGPLSQNLSIKYHDLGQIDSAKYYAELNLIYQRASGSQSGLMRAYGSLARVNLELGNLEAVHTNVDKVLNTELSDLVQYQTTRNGVMRYKAQAYLKAGKLNEALEWGIKCRNHAENSGLKLYQHRVDQVLYEVYKELGNFRAALDHFEKASVVEDSLIGVENFEKVKELNTRFESEQRLREISELERKAEIQELTISRQRSNQIFGAVGILVLGAVGYLFFNQRLLREKQVRLMTRQKLLRSQLNPHFLYNAMNAIQFVILDGGSAQKASDYVAKFAQLTRQILEYSEQEEILLEDEISFLENYIQIQQLRLKEPFQFSVHVSEGVEPDTILLPPMLGQPFVENAIEHGISSLGEKGKLETSFSILDGQLQIGISDNGVGRMPDVEKAHKSMATKITEERITILKKKYQNTSFEIHDLTNDAGVSNGTKVIFKLPLIYE